MCQSCGRSTCENKPTDDLPILIPCPSCDEKGCDHCEGKGYFQVTDCPKDYIGHKVSSAANKSNWIAKGIMPEAGGLNDQDAWFVSVLSTLEADTARIEDERRKRG